MARAVPEGPRHLAGTLPGGTVLRPAQLSTVRVKVCEAVPTEFFAVIVRV